MIQLPQSLHAWGSAAFASSFKQELAQLGVTHLPLQQGLAHSSIALNDAIEVMLISVNDDGGSLHIKAGLFYAGLIAGCNCADDPAPVDVNNEYCVVSMAIDKLTAKATVTLLVE